MRFSIGAGLKCDLSSLIDTRALIQANSGGGKSWILRRLLEQTHGHVQQIVLDPEGEFASLREKFDYVLAAKSGGDTAADPRGAKLLAERLLELKVSAIVDLYELKAHERIRFVRLFLEALVDAPKTLWHPALIVLDEAHVFCPEKGEAESAGAVIDLATRGRKRGFCALLATQRIAKLHKDAAAELNNKLIGRTGQDIDVKRAADELGFSGRAESYQLRDLAPGEFFAFGPALSRTVVKVTVGPVETTHPKAGARLAFIAPPPTDKVRALLPKLADLPAEAEQKAKTEAQLKQDLTAARATITRLERLATLKVEPRAQIQIERVVVPMLTEEHLAALKAAAATVQTTFAGARGLVEQLAEDRGALTDVLRRIDTAIAQATKPRPVQTSATPRPDTRRDMTAVRKPATRAAAAASDGHEDGHDLGRGERAVLIAIAQHDAGVTREQLTVLTGYKRSTRNTYLQRLGSWGFVADQGELVVATAEGVAALGGDFEPLPTGAALLEHWRRRLPKGERECLEVAVAAYPDAVPREAISDATSFARSSRNTYLQRLGARKLIEFEGETVRASRLLFEGAA